MSRVPVERAIDKLIQQGIELLQGGELHAAREILSQAVMLDPHSEKAWLWRSGAVETDTERKLCLEQVLRINPHNEVARQGLTHLVHPSAALSAAPSPPPTADGSSANAAERRIKRLSIQPPPAPEPASERAPEPTPEPVPDAASKVKAPMSPKKIYSSEMLYWPELERRRRPLWLAVVVVIIVIVIGAYTLLHSLHIIDALQLPVMPSAALTLFAVRYDFKLLYTCQD